MVVGVVNGFEKELEINGVGYRAHSREQHWYWPLDIHILLKWYHLKE